MSKNANADHIILGVPLQGDNHILFPSVSAAARWVIKKGIYTKSTSEVGVASNIHKCLNGATGHSFDHRWSWLSSEEGIDLEEIKRRALKITHVNAIRATDLYSLPIESLVAIREIVEADLTPSLEQNLDP